MSLLSMKCFNGRPFLYGLWEADFLVLVGKIRMAWDSSLSRLHGQERCSQMNMDSENIELHCGNSECDNVISITIGEVPGTCPACGANRWLWPVFTLRPDEDLTDGRNEQ